MKQSNQQNRKEKGFAHVALIAVAVIILALAAFGGWWVWEKNKEGRKTNDAAAQNTDQENEEKVKAPEGWKLYQNNEAGFSFYYPPEWGDVKDKGSESFEFSSLKELIFQANRRDKDHTQGHFGTLQLNNAIDVFLRNQTAFVSFLTGGTPSTREEEFKGDEIMAILDNAHACVLDDASVYESYMNDPELINSYVYFGYCGLNDTTYGAVSFVSNSVDVTKDTTQQFKDKFKKLLQTFEITN